MKNSVKALWVEHLKSEWYEQNLTDEEPPLRTLDNRWSVFGVLCNIHAQQFPAVAETQESETSYLGLEYTLPHQVALWAGLKERLSVPFEKEVSLFGRKFRTLQGMSDANIPFFIMADMIDLYL